MNLAKVKLHIENAELSELVAYRHLALIRIRELKPPPYKIGRWRGFQQILKVARQGLQAVFGLFEPLELVRQVGPNERPLERHEWEKQEPGPRIL